MDTKKPPDPPDPEPFEYSPILTISLPDDNVPAVPVDAESTNRKRVATSPPTSVTNPPKLIKKEIGRKSYTQRDSPPYIVHVSLKDGQTPGTVLHPVKFGMFLTENNYSNILLGSVKRLGRNRISVEFKSHQDANSFLISRTLEQNNFIASVPQFNITRLGLVRDVPTEWTEDEIIKNIKVPDGCGPVIKARRMNRKVTSLGVTEWKPTQTVILTFDGQILPKRVYCFYSALPVERYMYPTIQCYNCCRFGHTRTICRSKVQCFKCGQDHPGDGCQIPLVDAFCISCTGNHYAIDKACPELGRQKAIKALMAENFISYQEASQVFPPVSRSYAEVSKVSPKPKPMPSPSHIHRPASQTTQSYRKTVSLKPKSHAPLSPSYDKQAHQALTQNYSLSPSQNGCAFPRDGAISPVRKLDSENILNIISEMLMTVLSNPTHTLPDHVAYKLSSVVNYIRNVPSPDIPSMEREEYYSQED